MLPCALPVLHCVKDTIYSKETDPLQKVALQARKSVREYWEYDAPSKRLEEWKKALEQD